MSDTAEAFSAFAETGTVRAESAPPPKPEPRFQRKSAPGTGPQLKQDPVALRKTGTRTPAPKNTRRNKYFKFEIKE